MKTNVIDIEKYEKCFLPTEWGEFTIYVWNSLGGREPVALCTNDLSSDEAVTVRIHSECLTGDVFHSLNCDCGYQKSEALRIIQESKNGIFLYDRQEGRGIGLYSKIKALKLQEKGVDTYEANRQLGFPADPRGYEIPIAILLHLGVKRVRLITNNPRKITAFENTGIEVIERIPLCKPHDRYNKKYLTDKLELGHHLFE